MGSTPSAGPTLPTSQIPALPSGNQEGASAAGGEVNLKLPPLSGVTMMGIDSWYLLLIGLIVSALGFVFGLVIYKDLKNMPVHESMREVSELIYETCKTYLFTQGKFLLILWVFIAVVVGYYFEN